MTVYNPGFHLTIVNSKLKELYVFRPLAGSWGPWWYDGFISNHGHVLTFNVCIICFMVVWSWQGLVQQRKMLLLENPPTRILISDGAGFTRFG
jgi:hypothetical protein